MFELPQSHFQAFDVVVRSGIDQPELARVETTNSADFFFKLRAGEMPSREFNWFHHWYSDDLKAAVVFSIARVNESYRLRFPRLADFLISPDDKTIVCESAVDTPPETVRHLFLDQVLPRVLGHRGHLIVHASSVQMRSGAGLAFVGQSGWGKSTLAASFMQDGAKFLGDDCLKLKMLEGKLIGVPAYPGARLWDDSIDALYPAGIKTGQVSHYSNKRRIMAESRRAVTQSEFKAVFFLQDPAESSSEAISIQQLRGSSTTMELIRRSFLLDVESSSAAAVHFKLIGEMQSSSPLFFSLQYPRDYARLKDVRAAISESVIGYVGREARQG